MDEQFTLNVAFEKMKHGGFKITGTLKERQFNRNYTMPMEFGYETSHEAWKSFTESWTKALQDALNGNFSMFNQGGGS